MAVNYRQLLEYRAAVEPLAAELAAERIGPTELARLDRLHELELSPELIGRNRFRALDVSFHHVLASASRNDYLVVAVRDIRVWMAPALDLLDSSPVRRQHSLDSHGALIECLRAGDRAGAGAAMRAHLRSPRRPSRRRWPPRASPPRRYPADSATRRAPPEGRGNMEDSAAAAILKRIEAEDIANVRLVLTDLYGVPRGKVVTARRMEQALTRGHPFAIPLFASNLWQRHARPSTSTAMTSATGTGSCASIP